MIRHTRWLVLSAGLAVVAYVVLWVGYERQWAWLTTVDTAALERALRAGSPAWVTGWNVFCTVLGPFAFRLVTLVVIVVALVRRNVRGAIFLAVSVELSAVVTEVAKYAAGRPRPATALVDAYGLSFPSGHALGVLVGVLALLTVALPVAPPRLRGWLVALGAVIVVAIGIGRVALNVHHPSDVLAGWALGYAYFVFCLLVVAPTRPVTATGETREAPDSAR